MTGRLRLGAPFVLLVFLAGCGVIPDDGGSLDAVLADNGLVAEQMASLDENTLVTVAGAGREAVMTLVHRDEGGTWSVSESRGDSATVDGGGAGAVAYGGETGLTWNMFVYGIGPPNLQEVRLLNRGGQVIMFHGDEPTWLVALPMEIELSDVRWRLTGEGGEILFDAAGLVPVDQ